MTGLMTAGKSEHSTTTYYPSDGSKTSLSISFHYFYCIKIFMVAESTARLLSLLVYSGVNIKSIFIHLLNRVMRFLMF